MKKILVFLALMCVSLQALAYDLTSADKSYVEKLTISIENKISQKWEWVRDSYANALKNLSVKYYTKDKRMYEILKELTYNIKFKEMTSSVTVDNNTGNTRSCYISNWTWRQTYLNNSYWWTCQVVSCNNWYYKNWNKCNYSWSYSSCQSWYHKEYSSSNCVYNYRSCYINWWTWTQEWNSYNSSWNNCKATSCMSGYYLSNWNCYYGNNYRNNNDMLPNLYIKDLYFKNMDTLVVKVCNNWEAKVRHSYNIRFNESVYGDFYITWKNITWPYSISSWDCEEKEISVYWYNKNNINSSLYNYWINMSAEIEYDSDFQESSYSDNWFSKTVYISNVYNPSYRECYISNWTWRQYYDWNSRSRCKPIDCDSWYSQNWNYCEKNYSNDKPNLYIKDFYFKNMDTFIIEVCNSWNSSVSSSYDIILWDTSFWDFYLSSKTISWPYSISTWDCKKKEISVYWSDKNKISASNYNNWVYMSAKIESNNSFNETNYSDNSYSETVDVKTVFNNR